MINVKEQLKKEVKEHLKNIEVEFSDGLIDRVVDHMEKEYNLKGINQSELDDFLDSDAIGEAINFFWNDYLNED